MFKRGWQKKLDKLKARASRVVVNLDDLPGDKTLLKKLRATGQTTLGEALQDKGVQEAHRRGQAVATEHELFCLVKGCKVTFSVQQSGDVKHYHLAISHADGREPEITPGDWDTPPPKFDKIREYMGAPKRFVAGGLAVHWSWEVE
jgi:hypothetical protein